jgi:hypothetical protein
VTSLHPDDSVFLNLSVEIGPRREWYDMTAQPGGWKIVDTQGDPMYRSTHNVTPEDVAEDIAAATVGHDFDGMWEVRSVRRDPAAVAADVCGVECTERPEDAPSPTGMLRVAPCKLAPRHEGRHDPKLGGSPDERMAQMLPELDWADAQITSDIITNMTTGAIRPMVQLTGKMLSPDDVFQIMTKAVDKMRAQPNGGDVASLIIAVLLTKQVLGEVGR